MSINFSLKFTITCFKAPISVRLVVIISAVVSSCCLYILKNIFLSHIADRFTLGATPKGPCFNVIMFLGYIFDKHFFASTVSFKCCQNYFQNKSTYWIWRIAALFFNKDIACRGFIRLERILRQRDKISLDTT